MARTFKVFGLIFILIVLVIGAFISGMLMFRPGGDSGRALLLDQKDRELEDKEKQIQRLDSQIAQLRGELEESSRKTGELQKRLQEANKALSFAQQGIKGAAREAEHQPSARVEPVEKLPPKPPEPPSTEVRRRPAESGLYETIRATPVFAEPSGSSRQVATIQKGVRVTVVRSQGDWLEVRSKHGNPPGFIRRDDAMYIERRD